VARVTYAALALALGALVSGFFIRSTAVPLFASIGLSALVLILILRGWARRMRQSEGLLEADEDEFGELEPDIVVVDPGEESAELPAVARVRSRRAQRSRSRDARADAEEFAAEEEEEEEEEPARIRPGRASHPAPSKPAVGGRRVVIIPGRTRYHVPGCRFAHGKGAEEISETAARRRKYTPCSVCLG
jgi:hypothetical protein